MLDGVSDRERYIESLESVRTLDFDLVVPAVALVVRRRARRRAPAPRGWVAPALLDAAGRGDRRVVEPRARGSKLTGGKSLVEGAATAGQYLISAQEGDTLGIYLGSAYINDFNYLGRTFRVVAQAEPDA